MLQTRSAALVRFGTTGFKYSYKIAAGSHRALSPWDRDTGKAAAPRDSGCQARSLGKAPPLLGAERNPPGRPRGDPASLARAQPTPEAAVTQHLAGSGRGGGVACSRTGVPRHRGLRPGPCLLHEADDALHRTVALQHAHGLHRHASPGDAATSGPGRARKEGDEGSRRRKRQHKPRCRHRGAFIRLSWPRPPWHGTNRHSRPAPALRGAP